MISFRVQRLYATVIVSAIVCNATSPVFRFLSFHYNAQGQTKVPGDVIHLEWEFEGDTAWDSCFLAIHPLADLHGDDSYIVGIHPQCGASSANIQIPPKPFNKLFPYNNSLFLVRLNTPYGTFADGNPFPIGEHYEEPWSRADAAAHGSFIVSIVAIIVAILVAIIPIYWEYRNNEKHKETKADILELRHNTTADLQSRVAELVRAELQRQSHTTIANPIRNDGNPQRGQGAMGTSAQADPSNTAPTAGEGNIG